MAGRITIKQAKSDILKQALLKVEEGMRKLVAEALLEGGNLIAQTAREMVPQSAKGSRGNPAGTLRDSLMADFVDKEKLKVVVGASLPFLKARNKTPANLPRWIEFGTNSYAPGEAHRYTMSKGGKTRTRKRGGTTRGHPGMPARPFLGPAYKINRKKVEKRVGDAVRKAIAAQALRSKD